MIIFALPDCPVFGGDILFSNSFGSVQYMTIGGGAEGGIGGDLGIIEPALIERAT